MLSLDVVSICASYLFSPQPLQRAKFLTTFGAGVLRAPSSVRIRPSDNAIFVIDGADYPDPGPMSVCVFSPDGVFCGKFAEEHLVAPVALAFDSDGAVVVTEGGPYSHAEHHRVQIFTAAGERVCGWGKAGTAEGEFVTPRGVAINKHEVFVADSGNHRTQVFSRDGAFRRMWHYTSEQVFAGDYETPSHVVLCADRLYTVYHVPCCWGDYTAVKVHTLYFNVVFILLCR